MKQDSMMKRIYSVRDLKYYTMLRQILYDLELAHKDYLWLISDIEAYPRREKYRELISGDFLLLSSAELLEMLEEDDFQWVWAVFSAIPPHYGREDILSFDLPYIMDAEGKDYDPHQDCPRLQHPYAEFELYAVDSSYMFLISDDEALISRFKKCYPLYSEE